jgi:DNA invertase Pin-like site-specific DNA recombinase
MAGVKVGYARTSTLEQVVGFEAQQKELKAAGCKKIFAEQLSSISGKRAQLAAAIDYLREGDALLVTRLDRLARSVADLVAIEAQLRAKCVALRILNPVLETETAAGRLMFNVIGAVAEFERSIMLERQRAGVAAAKLAGKYKGRHPAAMLKADQVRELLASGIGPTEAARKVGISRTSVFRIMKGEDASA